MKKQLPFCLAWILLLCLWATPTLAAESEARIQLETTINKVLRVLEKPGLHTPAERPAILAEVEALIRDMFDFAELSARAVGPAWKNFSTDQKNRFTEAFTNLLRETYLGKLNGYNGETVAYVGETTSTKGDKVEVQTTVTIKNQPVPVAYRMLKKNRWVVYDMVIEGVSMVQNYRTQFQDMLDKGDAEKLIAQIIEKAAAVRENNQQAQTKS